MLQNDKIHKIKRQGKNNKIQNINGGKALRGFRTHQPFIQVKEAKLPKD